MGITDITLEESVNGAVISVLESIENNNPFDLIISEHWCLSPMWSK
jgi:hypothetical protein